MANQIIQENQFMVKAMNKLEKRLKNKKRELTPEENKIIDVQVEQARLIGTKVRKTDEYWSEYFESIHKLEFTEVMDEADYLAFYEPIKSSLEKTKESRDFLTKLNFQADRLKKLKTENNVIDSIPKKEEMVTISFPLLQYRYKNLFMKIYKSEEETIYSLAESIWNWGRNAKDYRKQIDQKLYKLEEHIIRMNTQDKKYIINKIKELHYWRRERRIIKEELQLVFEVIESLKNAKQNTDEIVRTIKNGRVNYSNKRENGFIQRWVMEKKEYRQTFTQLIKQYEKKEMSQNKNDKFVMIS